MTKRNRWLVFILPVVLIVGLVVAGCGPAEPVEVSELQEQLATEKAKVAGLEAEIAELTAVPEVIRWKLQPVTPPVDPVGMTLPWKFAELVAERSNGRLIVECFNVGDIVPYEGTVDALKGGILDISVPFYGEMTGIAPVGDVLYGLPFSWDGPQTMDIYNNYGLQEIAVEVFAPHNLRPLSIAPIKSDLRIVANYPISTLDDLKGKKFFATGVMARLMDKLGCSNVYLPLFEVYLGLEQRVIDGALYCTALFESGQMIEVITHVIETPVLIADNVAFVANLDSWNELPEDLKGIVDTSAKDAAMANYQGFRDVTASAYEAVLQEPRIKVIQLSDTELEELQRIAYEIWDELAQRDDYSLRAVNIIKDYYSTTWEERAIRIQPD